MQKVWFCLGINVRLIDLLNVSLGWFWFGLMLNVPVNNFSVMLGQSHHFLGIASTQGHNTATRVVRKPRLLDPRSDVNHDQATLPPTLG